MVQEKQSEPQFITTDGKKFSDRAKAERHERLIEAQTAYESSRHDYTRALAETHQTADGYEFSFDGMRTYYYVSENIFSPPRIADVSFYIWHVDIDEQDQGAIRQKREGSKDWIVYRIANLYRDKSNALARQIELYEAFLKEHQNYLDDLKEQRQRAIGA